MECHAVVIYVDCHYHLKRQTVSLNVHEDNIFVIDLDMENRIGLIILPVF